MSAVAAPAMAPGTQWRAFRMVLYRDLYVTWKEFPAFLAQVIPQTHAHLFPPVCLLLLFSGTKLVGAVEIELHPIIESV